MPHVPDADIQFDCPLCNGVFEAPAELLGKEVECPHCGQPVELPVSEEISEPAVVTVVEEESLAEIPVTSPQSEPKRPKPVAPEPRHPLTREELEAARRRFNLILAAVGGVILAIAFVVLASFG